MWSNADIVVIDNDGSMDIMINDFGRCTFVYGVVTKKLDFMNFKELLVLMECVNNLKCLLVTLMKRYAAMRRMVVLALILEE